MFNNQAKHLCHLVRSRMEETPSTEANHHKEKRKRISRQRRSLSYAVSLHIRTSPVAINIAAITIKFRRRSVFFPRDVLHTLYFMHRVTWKRRHSCALRAARVYYK